MSNEITAAFIEKHHPHVKELMLQRQKEQTGESDWNLFAYSIYNWFGWVKTPENHVPWEQALIHGNFAPLYALHPEWGEEPKLLIDEEWYWVKVVKDGAWEASQYFDGEIGKFPPYVENRYGIMDVEQLHAIHPELIKKPK